MRILIFCLVILFPVSLLPIEDLKKAEKLYNEKKFSDALKIYEDLEKEGYRSGPFYYNLGNIHYRLGHIGKAILYYEKAKKMMPNDENIQHNLSVCYTKTIDKVEVNENFFIQSFKQGMIYRFSEKNWGILSVLMSFISAVLLAISLHLSVRWRSILMPAGLLILIVSFLFFVFGKILVNESNKKSFAIVLAKEIKVKSEPLEHSFVKFKLHEGSKVRIQEMDSEYSLIRLPNGSEGWVRNSELGFI
ncbi:MAG: tetratricopeptide repeat protein [Bacteroidia bacterium]|nr:tetratricopeptide repeat protein [Bacteroidia bacterium]